MSGAINAVMQRLLEQRESWHELEPAVGNKPAQEVLLRRPPESELSDYRPKHAGQTMQQLLIGAVCTQAVGWRGISEADLIGADVGSSDPLPFTPELWALVARDRMTWLTSCAGKLMVMISDHLAKQAAISKNSPPSLTQAPASSSRAKKARSPSRKTASP